MEYVAGPIPEYAGKGLKYRSLTPRKEEEVCVSEYVDKLLMLEVSWEKRVAKKNDKDEIEIETAAGAEEDTKNYMKFVSYLIRERDSDSQQG